MQIVFKLFPGRVDELNFSFQGHSNCSNSSYSGRYVNVKYLPRFVSILKRLNLNTLNCYLMVYGHKTLTIYGY